MAATQRDVVGPASDIPRARCDLTETRPSLRGAPVKPQCGFTCSDAAIHLRIMIEVGWMDCFAEPVIGRAERATRWLAMTADDSNQNHPAHS